MRPILSKNTTRCSSRTIWIRNIPIRLGNLSIHLRIPVDNPSRNARLLQSLVELAPRQPKLDDGDLPHHTDIRPGRILEIFQPSVVGIHNRRVDFEAGTKSKELGGIQDLACERVGIRGIFSQRGLVEHLPIGLIHKSQAA